MHVFYFIPLAHLDAGQKVFKGVGRRSLFWLPNVNWGIQSPGSVGGKGCFVIGLGNIMTDVLRQHFTWLPRSTSTLNINQYSQQFVAVKNLAIIPPRLQNFTTLAFIS